MSIGIGIGIDIGMGIGSGIGFGIGIGIGSGIGFDWWRCSRGASGVSLFAPQVRFPVRRVRR